MIVKSTCKKKDFEYNKRINLVDIFEDINIDNIVCTFNIDNDKEDFQKSMFIYQKDYKKTIRIRTSNIKSTCYNEISRKKLEFTCKDFIIMSTFYNTLNSNQR